MFERRLAGKPPYCVRAGRPARLGGKRDDAVWVEPFPGEVRNLYCDNVTLNPKSQVLNYGSNAQLTLFNVNFEIKFNGSVIYSDTKQITLEISQSKTVNFTPYTIPVDQPGIYSVRSWSALQTDSNKSNDTSYSEFRANPNPNYGYSEISDYYFLNSSSTRSVP